MPSLTQLASLYLMGLPHGWETATSRSDFGLRFLWIAGFLVPVPRQRQFFDRPAPWLSRIGTRVPSTTSTVLRENRRR